MKLETGTLKLALLAAVIFPLAGHAVTGPKLVCDAPVFQFGRVGQAAVITNVFLIRNEGDTTFVAGMLRTTCSCTKVKISKRMIGPGETAELTAVFTAERRRGEQRKTIYLPPSGSETASAVFYMQGFVEPPAESH